MFENTSSIQRAGGWPRSGKARPQPRRGTTLLETIVAGVLLGTLMTVAVPTLGWVARERRVAEQRQQALAEVANVIERLAARDWDQITPEHAAEVQLAEEISRQLPGAEMKTTVQTPVEQPNAKRVSIQLSWNDPAGRPLAPVRLTAWVYQPRRAE